MGGEKYLAALKELPYYFIKYTGFFINKYWVLPILFYKRHLYYYYIRLKNKTPLRRQVNSMKGVPHAHDYAGKDSH
jgi:hypothetical protein